MQSAADDLRDALLTPAEAVAMDAHGSTDAAVLVPMYGHPDDPGLVLTERLANLRLHSGEISFPGGRRDPPEELLDTALREAEEEISLRRTEVEVVGALPPVGTFVTGYAIYPFVALIPRDLPLEPNPAEVESVLLLRLADLRAGFAMRRLVRRGVPIRTPTYVVDDHLIWGATARILGSLLERIDGGRSAA